MLSLQSHALLNYIDNSATEDELVSLKSTIETRLRNIQNTKLINSLLPDTDTYNTLLKSKLVSLEHHTDEEDYGYKGHIETNTYILKFVNNQQIRFWYDYDTHNGESSCHLCWNDDEFGSEDESNIVVIYRDKLRNFIQSIDLTPDVSLTKTFLNLLNSLIDSYRFSDDTLIDDEDKDKDDEEIENTNEEDNE